MVSAIAAGLVAVAAAGCGRPSGDGNDTSVTEFLREANETMLRLGNANNQAGWVQATYITQDTEALAARANEAYVSAVTNSARRAAGFGEDAGTPDERRQLTVLKNHLTMAAPADPELAAELTQLVASMESTYGRGSYCPNGEGDNCLDINDITRIMAESRDAARLREVWEGWRAIAPPMKQSYTRFVDLSNTGARELGFEDTGAMWRSTYDMPPDAFAQELDRLWEQLRPLYVSLHAYVRTRLRASYGAVVPVDGPIPAHLLGNIWAQDWTNIYDLVAPPRTSRGVPLDDILRTRNISPVDMVRHAERFFLSLGFEPLPQTFWERSLFVKPRDRDVVCHASAWNLDNVDDLRIKMCIEQTAEDFTVIHHELGHNFYQRAYNHLPPILRDSANDGFHEAIGDTIALSVTPEYLARIGLLERVPPASDDIGLLLERALEKLAFLPFGLVVDQWRWRVFNGEVTPDAYNRAWWELRERYQGVRAPSARGEDHFDPGAKYHVPANVPYARYFLASILQFQFHRALADIAGCTGPLHRCSIYESREAGRRLADTLSMGASRPWPDALEALTGQREMDAAAMADYFAPLKSWLDEQNAGSPMGW